MKTPRQGCGRGFLAHPWLAVMLSEAKHLAVGTVLTRAYGEILHPRKRGLRMTILSHLP